jgi:cysteinyl-tRNA synthetase
MKDSAPARIICRLIALSLLLVLGTACDDHGAEPATVGSVPTKVPGGLTTAFPVPESAEATGPFDKFALWSGGTQLRGANIYQRRVYPELDGLEFVGPGPVGPPYTQEDFERLAALGANYVAISHPGLFTEKPPYVLDEGVQSNLDNLLSMIAQADMFGVISFRTGPGRAEFSVCCLGDDWFSDEYLNDAVWEEQGAQDGWVEMWRYTAERYRHNSIVVGYDLMVEPNANEVLSGDWLDPEEFYGEYGGGLADWNQLFPRITKAIRRVDSGTPLLVGGMGYSGVEWLPYLEPTGDPRTVYAVHQYAPHLYTHQWADSLDCTYPGSCDLDWDGDYGDVFDRAWLNELLSPVDDFADTYGVPVAASEFGVVRWDPGAAEFMTDLIDLFERRGMNHALWSWDPDWAPWAEEADAFDFRHGPDPGNHSDLLSSELVSAILGSWSQNEVRPSSVTAEVGSAGTTASQPAPGASTISPPLTLDQVRFWAYQIQDVSAPGAVDALVESHYDMLVLEPTRTDWSSDEKGFDTAAMVSRLKSSKASDGEHRKLVLAYIDIGEAEYWRWYWTWTTDWDCRLPTPVDWPDYILECDPDGWTGNYPVAYWDPDWKKIMIYGQPQGLEPGRDYASAVDETIQDGFDGIYLDWVEGWENEAVVEAAREAGKDPAAEMITFIGEMRTYARARTPGFLVVQQNAAELIDGHPELLDVIDAIAQEAIWYDGDATDDWQDPDGYDWENSPDLSAYYLEHLAAYRDAGLPVFNCEYAQDHAERSYAISYAEGMVPYASRRSLWHLTTTPPPDY